MTNLPRFSHVCDRCGRPIEARETRYEVLIRVKSSADPLKVTADDLQRDLRLQMEHLIEQAEAMDESELMEDVFVERRHVICRRCRIKWLLNPLGGRR